MAMSFALLRSSRLGVATLLLLLASPLSRAASSYWTNTAATGNFTNPAMWSSGVPGAADDAWFASNATSTLSFTADATTANASVSVTNRTVTFNVSNSTWWVTNRFSIAPEFGRTSLVGFSSGSVLITNTQRTAVLELSAGSRGTLTLAADTQVKADFLLATNNTSSAGNPTLAVNSGLLETFRGSVLSNGSGGLMIANQANARGAWSILGGSNLLDGISAWGLRIASQGGATGIWNISGPVTYVRIIGNAGGGGQILASSKTNSLAMTTISNGATLVTPDKIYWGNAFGGVAILNVTGPGSLLQADGSLIVGTNDWTNLNQGGDGLVLVSSGATLQVRNLYVGYGNHGAVSNTAGILQFNRVTPIISNASPNGIVSTDGIISFLNVGTAPVWITNSFLTNFTFSGSHALRLNSATNASVGSYTFQAAGVGTNYQSLQILGTDSRWQGGSLAIASDASMLVSNAVNARIYAAFSNAGTVRVFNSTLRFMSNAVFAGGLVTDPSTLTFESNATVAAGGWIAATNDTFVFYRSFLNQSTNRSAYRMNLATALFTNGNGQSAHSLVLSNSAAANLGGVSNFAAVADNFSIGVLSLAANNTLTLAGNADGFTNALYVGWLDLQGIDTNSFDSVTNALSVALNLPNINLYYDRFDPRNDWLNANLPAGGYSLWGGGMVLPIPEPSSLLVLAFGTGALASLRRRVNRQPRGPPPGTG